MNTHNDILKASSWEKTTKKSRFKVQRRENLK
jgi:hypothetical protein